MNLGPGQARKGMVFWGAFGRRQLLDIRTLWGLKVSGEYQGFSGFGLPGSEFKGPGRDLGSRRSSPMILSSHLMEHHESRYPIDSSLGPSSSRSYFKTQGP